MDLKQERELTQIPIERGGGKMEGELALAAAGFPVPKSRPLYYPELDQKYYVLQAYRSLKKPIIVRGSHQNDWSGYIDVIPTKRNVTTEEGLFESIKEIKHVAGREDTHIHAQDWGQTFSKEVHVLLQEQSSSPVMGVMLRHPHQDWIDINYVDKSEYRQPDHGYMVYSAARKYPNDHMFRAGVFADLIDDDQAQSAFQLYEQIETCGLFNPNFVYQMEIGFNPLQIFQVRPFKKREQTKNFDLPVRYDSKFPHVSSQLVFGTTNPSGENVRFAIGQSAGFVNGTYPENDEPYGILLQDSPYDSYATGGRFGNLAVYAAETQGTCYLDHGDYRLLKRARISLLNYLKQQIPHEYDQEFTRTYLENFSESKIWSNGRHGLIVPTEIADKEGL